MNENKLRYKNTDKYKNRYEQKDTPCVDTKKCEFEKIHKISANYSNLIKFLVK